MRRNAATSREVQQDPSAPAPYHRETHGHRGEQLTAHTPPRGSRALQENAETRTAPIQRSDSSDLSAASTPCGCSSPNAPSKMQSEPVDSAARRGVRSTVPRELIWEEFHVDARLRGVHQPPRRQKLQSQF